MLFKLIGRSKHKTVDIVAPLSGKIVNRTEMKVDARSRPSRDDAVAIVPEDGQIVAPFVGSVSEVAGNGHSIVVEHASGLRLQIDIGLPEPALEASAFYSYVQAGDTFRAGDTLIDFDIDAIHASGYSPITSVAVANADLTKRIVQLMMDGSVSSGHEVILRAELDG